MYTLHYAPDNASLIIRLALEICGAPYRTVLVDRAVGAQRSAAYLKLNPNGLIPALETPDGVLFETGAILLWLADRHRQLGAAPDSPERGDFLKWLFFVSNTLHPALRRLFYPAQYVSAECTSALRSTCKANIAEHLQVLESAAPEWRRPSPGAVEIYVAACLRWCALYPTDADREWFDLRAYPALYAMCERLETLPCIRDLQKAEGISGAPFTIPCYATPPEGSAT